MTLVRRWMVSTAAGIGALGWVAVGAASAQRPPAQPRGGGGMCACGERMGGGGGAGCGAMIRRSANVTVQETDDGAIIRLRAKDPSQVEAVQRHAQMMSSCMGGQPPPAPSE